MAAPTTEATTAPACVYSVSVENIGFVRRDVTWTEAMATAKHYADQIRRNVTRGEFPVIIWQEVACNAEPFEEIFE